MPWTQMHAGNIGHFPKIYEYYGNFHLVILFKLFNFNSNYVARL